MKKILLSTLVLAATTMSALATANKNGSTVTDPTALVQTAGTVQEEASFDSNFKYSSFEKNGKKYAAVYKKEDGELIGTAVLINNNQVPESIKELLSKKFEGYQLTGKAIHVEYEEYDSYVLTLENEVEALTVRVDGKTASVTGKLKKM
jgi:uncharacterized protein YxeA